MKKEAFIRILSLIILVGLVSMAYSCSVLTPVSVTKIKTQATKIVDIQAPLPEASSEVILSLNFLAGDLKLSPGANGYLAVGTATYNAAEFEPIVETSGITTTLKSGDLKIEGIPKFDDQLVNTWDLKLANLPMSLKINTGPYEGNLELGGLSLENLVISELGSSVNLSFSTPNQVEMASFIYSTGGSTMTLKGLANANFAEMNFDSGAGDFTLSFDGELKRDATVKIGSGASTVNIIIPNGVNAQLTFGGGLTTINADSRWVKNGSLYTLSGSGPTLKINVSMGLGTLNLKAE
jgi:hypothetical protein